MYGFVQYRVVRERGWIQAGLVVASLIGRSCIGDPVGHVQIRDGYMKIIPKDVFRVLLAQVAVVRMNSVGARHLCRIKNADRKCDVPRWYSGTLDPLTLMVKREHHYCFYLLTLFFTETREKQIATQNR